MITDQSVWNTKTQHYIDEHDASRGEPSRQYVLDFIEREGIRSVLELGIGSGVFLDNLASRGLHPRYIGIDASYKFREYVLKRHPGTTIWAHDCDSGLPLSDNSVQLVYARHVLEHINNPNIVAEMARVAQAWVIVVLFRPLADQTTIGWRAHKGAYYNSYGRDWMEAELGRCFAEWNITECDGNDTGPAKAGRNWIMHGKK